jgi:hypothetical protein
MSVRLARATRLQISPALFWIRRSAQAIDRKTVFTHEAAFEKSKSRRLVSAAQLLESADERLVGRYEPLVSRYERFVFEYE